MIIVNKDGKWITVDPTPTSIKEIDDGVIVTYTIIKEDSVN